MTCSTRALWTAPCSLCRDPKALVTWRRGDESCAGHEPQPQHQRGGE